MADHRSVISRFAPRPASADASCSARRSATRARRGSQRRWSSTGRRRSTAPTSSGSHTVGDLLEHLPARPPRGARRSPSSSPGETRDRRGRGPERSPRGRSAGAGCGRWSRRRSPTTPGAMKATFFNQPWLVQPLPARHAARAARQVRGAQPLRASRPTRRTDRGGRRRRRRGRPLSGHRRALARPRSWRSCARTPAALDDVVEPLPARLRVARAACPTGPRALTAAHFPDGAATLEAGRRRLAFDELLLAQLALLRRRRAREQSARARRRSTATRELTARWLVGAAAVRADRRPAARRSSRSTQDLAQQPADAAAADGRGRLGQDRGRAVRAAAGGRARLPGRR